MAASSWQEVPPSGDLTALFKVLFNDEASNEEIEAVAENFYDGTYNGMKEALSIALSEGYCKHACVLLKQFMQGVEECKQTTRPGFRHYLVACAVKWGCVKLIDTMIEVGLIEDRTDIAKYTDDVNFARMCIPNTKESAIKVLKITAHSPRNHPNFVAYYEALNGGADDGICGE